MDLDPKQFTTWTVGIRRAESILYYLGCYDSACWVNLVLPELLCYACWVNLVLTGLLGYGVLGQSSTTWVVVIRRAESILYYLGCWDTACWVNLVLPGLLWYGVLSQSCTTWAVVIRRAGSSSNICRTRDLASSETLCQFPRSNSKNSGSR